MAKLQGQKVSSGFWSGFVASGFAAPKSFGLEKGTFVNAVVGGTTSELTGGKFANGAVTGAFVHLFNAEYDVMNSNLPRAMSVAGKAGISDEQANFNDNVSLTISSITGTLSSSVVFGVKKTFEAILSIAINYQNLTSGHIENYRFRYGAKTRPTIEKMEKASRMRMNWRNFKIWIP